MHKKYPTVTVALSAYNEQKNIKKLIESIKAQREIGFRIKAIWVYSDGSTDKTVERARKVSSKKIAVINSQKRIGKSARLNQIYKKLKTDILVQTDADVVFAHTKVIKELIKPLIKEKNVAMTGGNPTPLPATTLIEKAINLTCEPYSIFRSVVRGGNNVFSADGRLLAYKANFIKKIQIPTDMIANDAFTYYSCKKLGYDYRYVERAKVDYRSPQNLKDHIKQNTRFLAAPLRMKKYFSNDLIDKETFIPRDLYLKVVLRTFLKNPFLSIYIFVINKYCSLRARERESFMNSKWDMAITTKNVLQ